MLTRLRTVSFLIALFLTAAAAFVSPARADKPGWKTFEDGSVTHGGDPKEIFIEGQTVRRPFDPASHDAIDTRADVEPDITTGARKGVGLPSVHAIYVYPKDAPNRFAQFAAMFQQDLRDASALLSDSYGRAVRIDERPSATLGSVVDITVVQANATAAQLIAGDVFTMVRAQLLKAFRNPDKKYVAWVDVDHPLACGQGTLYPDVRRTRDNYNQRSSFAMIYAPSEVNAIDGGFCPWTTVLHELGHAFGALQQVAPHAFDGAHCDDSDSDIMCYPLADRWFGGNGALTENPQAWVDGGVAGIEQDVVGEQNLTNPLPLVTIFDYGNDDYWDPAAVPGFVPSSTDTGRLRWWTVNLSRFLCSTEGCDKAANDDGGYTETSKRPHHHR